MSSPPGNARKPMKGEKKIPRKHEGKSQTSRKYLKTLSSVLLLLNQPRDGGGTGDPPGAPPAADIYKKRLLLFLFFL